MNLDFIVIDTPTHTPIPLLVVKVCSQQPNFTNAQSGCLDIRLLLLIHTLTLFLLLFSSMLAGR